MRLGTLLLLGSSVFAVVAVVACTRAPAVEEEGDDDDDTDGGTKAKPKPGDGKETPKANTCLGKANLAFENTACNTCMSDDANCCAATIKCFNDNAECKKLQGCMETCAAGDKDAGVLVGCQAKCKTDNGGGLSDWQVFNGCTQNTCATECKAGGGTTPTKAATPKEAFTALFAKVNPACGACHKAPGVNGAKVFIGASEDETYTLFKGAGYEKATATFSTKGAHAGPALAADAKAAYDSWVKAEAGGGAGTGGGDGGGGGNGTGGGGGGGGGGGK